MLQILSNIKLKQNSSKSKKLKFKISLNKKKNKKIEKKVVKKVEKTEKKEKKQIIDTKKPILNRKPKKSKYYSKYNNKVKKERRSKYRNKPIAIKGGGRKKNNRVVKNSNKKGEKRNKEKRNKELKKDNNKTIAALKKNRNSDNLKKEKGNKGKNRRKKLDLSLSNFEFSQMVKTASNDYLRDLKEAEKNMVNTESYQYANYFLKLKRKVAKEWNPASAYNKNDPYRKIYGIKDRYTILKVTVGKDGFLKKIKVKKSSGLIFLDKEAVRSFEKAQPFKVVPKGLVVEREFFTFLFGFYVENPDSPSIFYLKR